MSTLLLTFFLNGLIVAPSAQTAADVPKDAPEARPARQPSNRRDRRDRFERYRNATPEQRRQDQVNRWVERATQTYELSDDQRGIVRVEIDNMQRERREAMGPEADEYDKLREQMFELWRRPSDGAAKEEADRLSRRERRRQLMEDPTYLKVRERLRELDEKYPVDWDAAMQRVEVLLPADQAEKGRARIQERQARREERQQRWRERSDQPEGQRRRGDRRSSTDGPGNRRNPAATESAAPAPQPIAAPTASPDAWELYVRDFIAKHDLTSAQQAAANGILKDIRSRAGQIELTLRDKVVAAEKMPDAAARTQRLAELHQPMDQLFTELKTRLDGLLTASQRMPVPRP